MSLHRSLKTKAGALSEHRNVLTRAERIEYLIERNRFCPDEDSPMGLAKVANRNIKKKKAAAKEAESDAETGAATEVAKSESEGSS
jgi:small basic protein (TIGR04137 family)